MTFNANDPTASGMVLTFDDEFDSSSISSDSVADGTLWNDHLWYESPNPGAITVANGIAQIVNGDLSTVNSQGQGFAQTYGYFEIDMKLPAGVGTWPAFWMMSQQHAVNGANAASELDIIEAQGSTPNGYYTTLHSDTATPQDTFNPDPNYTGDLGVGALSDSYHRYGVLWSPNSDVITFYFDGKPIATATEYSTTNASPMMVNIDNVLGDMGIGTNAPTPGEADPPLDVDYVRVYQFASQDPTAVVAQLASAPAGDTDPTVLANADGVGSVTAADGTTAASDPAAVAPTLTVANASGVEGSSIPLSISAAQAAADLPAADLSVTVTGLDGATLDHGTANSDGSYTLQASDLSGLTLTPAAGYTGTLALTVTATDTEPSSGTSAATPADTLDVTVSAPAGSTPPPATTGAATPPATTGTTTPPDTSGTSTPPTSTEFNPQNPAASGMVLTFDDEFNQSSISADGIANNTLWNNHLWYESPNPGGVTVADGVATLTSNGDLSTLDSAGQGFSQKYGYFEASVEFSGGAGGVPAFWLMSAQHADDANAPATDIDVMKSLTGSPTEYAATVKSDAGSADDQVSTNTVDLTQGFHTYGVLWSPGSADLIWYLDGKEVAETAAPSDINSAAMMLNLSLNPGTGANAATAGSDAAMQVDWVHVYQFADQDPTAIQPQAGFSETGPTAAAPTLTVADASGAEGSAIPLSITAAQAAADLSAADLSVTVTGLDGATLNHGTANSDGSYTLQAADLSGLTLTPAAGFAGTLALGVTATDTETASATTASSPAGTLDVTVSPQAALQPSFSDGMHEVYLLSTAMPGGEHITNFNPADDVLDLAPILKAAGYTGTSPIADHVVTLAPTANGSTAVMVDPTGQDPSHGTTVVTLDHVLPQNVPASDVWH